MILTIVQILLELKNIQNKLTKIMTAKSIIFWSWTMVPFPFPFLYLILKLLLLGVTAIFGFKI